MYRIPGTCSKQIFVTRNNGVTLFIHGPNLLRERYISLHYVTALCDCIIHTLRENVTRPLHVRTTDAKLSRTPRDSRVYNARGFPLDMWSVMKHNW